MSDDIKTKLLDAAQLLVQTRGHNGYSYRDLAEQVGIRTASIHYHFPTKTDLAVALVRRYRERIVEAMANVAVSKTSLGDRLDAVCQAYASTLKQNSRVCVSCALAAEYASLPPEVQAELKGLITDSQTWLTRFLSEARSQREIPGHLDPDALAKLWYATLQGALVMARASQPDSLNEVASMLKKMTLTPGQ